MDAVDLRVREPTGRGWLFSVVCTILSAELFYEMRGRTVSIFFGMPLSRTEVFSVATLIAAAALISAIYVVSLYVRPGHLQVGAEGLIRKRRKGLWRWHTTRAPLRNWHVHLTFFSTNDQRRGVFKRLQLDGPGIGEVLLFTDLRDGSKLVKALQPHRGAFGTFNEVVQNPDATATSNLDQEQQPQKNG